MISQKNCGGFFENMDIYPYEKRSRKGYEIDKFTYISPSPALCFSRFIFILN